LAVTRFHTVGKQVRFKERKIILPLDVFEKFAKINFWTDNSASKAKILLSVEIMGDQVALAPNPV